MNLSLSIKHKHLLIIFLMVVGLLAVGGVALYEFDTVGDLRQSQVRIGELSAGMLTLRRDEKDFLARLDDRYVQRFGTEADKNIVRARALADELAAQGVDGEKLKQLASYLEEYQAAFDSLVNVQKRIGYDHEKGLYGALRAKVHAAEEALSEEPEVRASMLMLRRHEKDFMLRRDAKYLQRFEQEMTQFLDISEGLLDEDEFESISELMEAYSTSFRALVDAERAKGLEPDQGVQGEMRAAVQRTEALFTELKTNLEKDITAASVNARRALLIMVCGISLVIVVLVFWVSRSIFRPLAAFQEEIAEIADQRDLTRRLSVDGKDEIAALGVSFNSLFDTLHTMVSKVSEAAVMLAAAAEEMSAVTREVQKSSESQAREVDQAAVAVNEMSATIQEIARNASSAADSVGVVHQHLQEGVRVGDEARGEIQTLTHEVQQAAAAMQELERNSENIGQVLDAIMSVAEQTNLLALNAAIEAARAGDQGRGFAVVADEVRTLAQRTQESTESIRQTIHALQQGTNHVVTTVDRSNQRAETGIERVSRSSKLLGEIAEMVGRINDMNTQIAAAAEEQGTVADEIGRNVTRVSDLSRSVAEQVEQTTAASRELAELGASLKNLVGQFRL